MIEFDSTTNEIYLYGEIGPAEYGMASAPELIKALKATRPDPVTLRINSPGGSAVEAQAMVAALERYPGEVTVEIDALAASAATIVALAGQRVNIAKNAFFMIHDPWSLAVGPAAEMRKMADVLDKFSESLGEQYARASGRDLAEIRDLMAAETWFSADEAVDYGFAHAISDAVAVAAKIREGQYKRAPAALFEQPKSGRKDIAARLRLLRLQ